MKLLLASLLLVITVQSLPRFSRGLDDPGQFVMDPTEYGGDDDGELNENSDLGKFIRGSDDRDNDNGIWDPEKDGRLNEISGGEDLSGLSANTEDDDIIFEGRVVSTPNDKRARKPINGNGRREFMEDLFEIIEREAKEKGTLRSSNDGKEVSKGPFDMDTLKELIEKSVEVAVEAFEVSQPEKSKKNARKGFLEIESPWRTGPPPIVLDLPQPWDEGDWKTDWEKPAKYVEKSKKSTRKGFRDILVDRSGPPPIVPQIPTVLTGIVPEFPWNRDDWKPDYYMDCFGVKIPTTPFGFRRKSAARKEFSETSLDPTDLDPPPFVPDYPIDLDEDEDLEDLESPVLHKSHRKLDAPDGRFVQGRPWWMENGKAVETEGWHDAEKKDDEQVKNRKSARRGGYVRKGFWDWLFPKETVVYEYHSLEEVDDKKQ